jgi:hypothetical protein
MPSKSLGLPVPRSVRIKLSKSKTWQKDPKHLNVDRMK